MISRPFVILSAVKVLAFFTKSFILDDVSKMLAEKPAILLLISVIFLNAKYPAKSLGN